MKKILIIEDDELIAELEKDYLEVSNYAVDIYEEGKSGWEAFQNNSYDLVILDVMLPGMDGFEICKRIRKDSDVPVIIVTAKKSDLDKIRGLGFGADDYMVKPFSPAELVARVKAHIGIHERLIERIQSNVKIDEESEKQLITVKNMVIDKQAHRVKLKGQEITLANKEYELLVFLAEHPDIVFSKDTLFDRIWGYDAIGDASTVIVHINRIRDKIETDTSEPEYIETVWGAGYRFKV